MKELVVKTDRYKSGFSGTVAGRGGSVYHGSIVIEFARNARDGVSTSTGRDLDDCCVRVVFGNTTVNANFC